MRPVRHVDRKRLGLLAMPAMPAMSVYLGTKYIPVVQ